MLHLLFPKIAVEVLIGHGYGHVVIETSAPLEKEDVAFIVDRMAPGIRVFIQIVPQDVHLAILESAFCSSVSGTPLKMPLSPHLIPFDWLFARCTSCGTI